MSANEALAPALQRLLAGARDGSDHLVTELQKGVRALSALSLTYNGHSLRAGVHDAALGEIDAELNAAAEALGRVLFELQQRLQLDVLTVSDLARIEETVDLADARALAERLREGLTGYITGLGPRLSGSRTTVADVAVRLTVLANNTEIAACRSGEAASEPVELFMLIAAQMRSLAARLRGLAGDLTVYEGTQEGNVEAVRAALRARPDGASSETEEAA